MKYRKIVFEIFLGVFLLMFTSTLLWSGEPGDLVKKVILKDISLKDGEVTKERKQKLLREMYHSFDFEEMTKSMQWVMYWMERSPEEKKRIYRIICKSH